MTKTRILYHPKFEPKESWLRAALLFYDTVHSIVPRNAPYTVSPRVAELCEKAPDAFVPIPPDERDLKYEWPEYHALSDVLQNLFDRSEGTQLKRARFDRVGGVPRLDFGEGVEVHWDKVAEKLWADLVNFGLAVPTDDPSWLRVDRRVADLVISMLASRMVMNRSGFVGTASDGVTPFAVAAKSAMNHGQALKWNQGHAEATLASAVLTAAVPAAIAELPLDRYLDLRNRYEPHRETFRTTMIDLANLYLQSNLHNPDEFKGAVESTVARFSQEMQTLREGQLREKVLKWTPVAIGGVVGIAAAVVTAPIVAVTASGVSFAIAIVQTALGERPYVSKSALTQSLLIDLERELHWNQDWLGRVFRW